MNIIGRNSFVPFPRYENAIFVGDSAIEALAELKIFAKALIGGELPNMQHYHPMEKLLECTSCVMHDQRVLKTAIRRGEIDYVVLENNPALDINPADLAVKLEAEGVPCKILDISEDPTQTLLSAGQLFDETKRAERVVREFRLLEEEIMKSPQLAPQSILTLLAIRHPLNNQIFLFALSDASELSQTIYPLLQARNPILENEFKTIIPGLVEIESLTSILDTDPNWIALTGDSLGLEQALAASREKSTFIPKALLEGKVFSVPYYGRPLIVRRPYILKLWREATEATLKL